MGTIKLNNVSSINSLVSLSSLSSCQSDQGVTGSGKWAFEVVAGTCGLQIGWHSSNEIFTSELGVGNLEHSYAFNGDRALKFNGSGNEGN